MNLTPFGERGIVHAGILAVQDELKIAQVTIALFGN
jgi:hypothetical protein